jgi:hypothetical protein
MIAVSPPKEIELPSLALSFKLKSGRPEKDWESLGNSLRTRKDSPYIRYLRTNSLHQRPLEEIILQKYHKLICKIC